MLHIVPRTRSWSRNSARPPERSGHAIAVLNSMGDAVISTDVAGHIDFLNAVAEDLTRWSSADAHGRLLGEVFHLIDAETREPRENPTLVAMRDNRTVRLPPNCLLVRRDGTEIPIEDSIAPIHDPQGTLIGAVIVFRDVSVAREQSRRLSFLAKHDSLTALPNRALLDDRLDLSIALADRHGQQLAVLFLDIDHFKEFNDSLGHAIGDRILQSVAERLRRGVRNSDTVFRLGGDEFIIVLTDTKGGTDAVAIADKLLSTLEAPHRIGPHELCLTASIGIAIYPADGTNADSLIRNADTAMYAAKAKGGNTARLYAPSEARVDLTARRLAST
ncbi:MAG: diguanylate cyclase [Steroidobacteraceae bacterium]